MSRSLALLVLCLLPATAAAQAPPPPPSAPLQARGVFVTGAYGLGTITRDGRESLDGDAAAFDLGVMLAPRTALLLDVHMVMHPLSEGALEQIVLGVLLRQYVSERVYVQAGLGAGSIVIEDAAGETVAESETGFALLAALGVELVQGQRIAVSLEARAAALSYGESSGLDDHGNLAVLLGLSWF